MNSASEVAKIFTTAGAAFEKLGELTMKLHPIPETSAGKWADEEIEMLLLAIKDFRDDLKKITDHIKSRTESETKRTLKRKLLVNAGIPEPAIKTAKQPSQQSQRGMLGKPAEVPLKRLNAPTYNVDIEGVPEDARVAFNPANLQEKAQFHH